MASAKPTKPTPVGYLDVRSEDCRTKRGLQTGFGVETVRNVAYQTDLNLAQKLGRVGLDAMEGRLATSDWLALDRPTIGDIACLPHVALAPEGRIDLNDYPSVMSWIARLNALPGFIAMDGMTVHHPS